MKGKIKKWLDTPITWRASFKASFYAMLAYGILIGGVYGCYAVKNELTNKWYEKERLKKLERECEEELTEEDEA